MFIKGISKFNQEIKLSMPQDRSNKVPKSQSNKIEWS